MNGTTTAAGDGSTSLVNSLAWGGVVLLTAGTLTLSPGTSSTSVQGTAEIPARTSSWTSGGSSSDPETNSRPESTADLLLEVRKVSGLTWEQLSTVFGVERRSVHFWAAGRPMNAPNAEKLAAVLAVVRRVNRGDPASTRAWLLAPTPSGPTPLDLLRAGRLQDMPQAATPAQAMVTRRPPAISRDAAAARAPHPPSELLNAEERPLRPTPGKLVRATPLKRNRTT